MENKEGMPDDMKKEFEDFQKSKTESKDNDESINDIEKEDADAFEDDFKGVTPEEHDNDTVYIEEVE